MRSRRFTRLTNAFSKRQENHTHAVALHFMVYYFCREHGTLTKPNGGIKTSPAMAAGLTDRVWRVEDVLDLMSATRAIRIMPIYEYDCPKCGHRTEQRRRMKNRARPQACERCGTPATLRVGHPFAIGRSEGRAEPPTPSPGSTGIRMPADAGAIRIHGGTIRGFETGVKMEGGTLRTEGTHLVDNRTAIDLRNDAKVDPESDASIE